MSDWLDHGDDMLGAFVGALILAVNLIGGVMVLCLIG